jgi:hypothetical protein
MTICMSRVACPLALFRALLVVALLAVVSSGNAQSQQANSQELSPEERECGSFYAYARNGPSDYRNTDRKVGGKLWLVEGAHFTPGIRNLTKQATGPFGSDLDYTLYSFPNHAPALVVMDRLADKEKLDPPKGAQHSVECYYKRAIRFLPLDLVPRILYADFLGRHNRAGDARAQLEFAASRAKDDGFTRYNIALVYFEIKAFDEAAAQAGLAMRLGFPRDDLKRKLQAMGKWVDPPTPAAAEPPGGAVPAASGASR